MLKEEYFRLLFLMFFSMIAPHHIIGQSFLNMASFNKGHFSLGIEDSKAALISARHKSFDANIRHTIAIERLSFQIVQVDIGWRKTIGDKLSISPRVFGTTNYKGNHRRGWVNIDADYQLNKFVFSYRCFLLSSLNQWDRRLLNQLGIWFKTSEKVGIYASYGNDPSFYKDRTEVALGALLFSNSITCRATYHLPIKEHISYSNWQLSFLYALGKIKD